MSDENGFLTNVDKQFLRGEKEYDSNQGRYDRRQSIAERARQAFHDFALLFDVLDKHERDRIFDIGVEDQPGKGADRVNADQINAFQDSLAATVAFLYLALEGEINDVSPPGYNNVSFKQVLEAGVSRAEIERRPGDRYDYVTDVEFAATVTEPAADRVERAIEKIADYRAHELSESELRALVISADPETSGTLLDEGWASVNELIQSERQSVADE